MPAGKWTRRSFLAKPHVKRGLQGIKDRRERLRELPDHLQKRLPPSRPTLINPNDFGVANRESWMVMDNLLKQFLEGIPLDRPNDKLKAKEVAMKLVLQEAIADLKGIPLLDMLIAEAQPDRGLPARSDYPPYPEEYMLHYLAELIDYLSSQGGRMRGLKQPSLADIRHVHKLLCPAIETSNYCTGTEKTWNDLRQRAKAVAKYYVYLKEHMPSVAQYRIHTILPHGIGG